MDPEGKPRPRRPVEGSLLALMFGFIAIAAVGLAARRWLPPLASEHGAGIDRMIHYLIVTVGTLFVAGHAVLAFFVWRFSRPGPVTSRLASPRTERVWSLVPVALMSLIAEGGVIFLGLPVWGKLYAAPIPTEAIAVEVTGEQFAWNIRYPGPDGRFARTDPKLIADNNPLGVDREDPAARDDRVEPAVLRLPVNRPVHIRLRSKDTIHGLFLPQFRIKQDAVPGMTIDVLFTPTRLGEFEIACAELCGLGHYQMRGLLQVMTAEDFEKWLRES